MRGQIRREVAGDERHAEQRGEAVHQRRQNGCACNRTSGTTFSKCLFSSIRTIGNVRVFLPSSSGRYKCESHHFRQEEKVDLFFEAGRHTIEIGALFEAGGRLLQQQPCDCLLYKEEERHWDRSRRRLKGNKQIRRPWFRFGFSLFASMCIHSPEPVLAKQ